MYGEISGNISHPCPFYGSKVDPLLRDDMRSPRAWLNIAVTWSSHVLHARSFFTEFTFLTELQPDALFLLGAPQPGHQSITRQNSNVVTPHFHTSGSFAVSEPWMCRRKNQSPREETHAERRPPFSQTIFHNFTADYNNTTMCLWTVPALGLVLAMT